MLTALANPEERRQLFLNRDSMIWTGVDALGSTIEEAAECFRNLGDMFQLHRDLVAADPAFEVPLPTYKRTPINDVLSDLVGFKFEVWSLMTLPQLRAAFGEMDVSKLMAPPATAADVRDVLFNGALGLDREAWQYPVLEMGWPMGVGVLKDAPLRGTIKAWDTVMGLLGGEHTPVRSSVILTTTSA